MDGNFKSNPVNPYTCGNPLLHKQKHRSSKFVQIALGTKILAIATFIPRPNESMSMKEENREKDAKSSKEQQEKQQSFELACKKSSPTTSKLQSKGMSRRRSNQVLPHLAATNRDVFDKTSSISKGKCKESNGHVQSKKNWADKKSFSEAKLNNKIKIQGKYSLKGNTQDRIQTSKEKSITTAAEVHKNGVLSLNNLTDTDLAQGHIKESSLGTKEVSYGGTIRHSSTSKEVELKTKYKTTNEDEIVSCSSTATRKNRNTGLRKTVSPKPLVLSKCCEKSLAERIIENRVMKGRVFDQTEAIGSNTGECGRSESAKQSKDNLLNNCDGTAQTAQPKGDSVSSSGVNLLRKHQPDLTPVEGENSCPIVKKRQNRKIVLC